MSTPSTPLSPEGHAVEGLKQMIIRKLIEAGESIPSDKELDRLATEHLEAINKKAP